MGNDAVEEFQSERRLSFRILEASTGSDVHFSRAYDSLWSLDPSDFE